MLFHDRAIIDGPARITREGHLVANARVARANNIQDYSAAELKLPPKADGSPYRIFRPEASIFDKKSLASATNRPIVINHPPEDVSAANWKRLSVGDTGGQILRDGEFMTVPVMIMDAAAVTAATTTHREFSWGYDAELDMTPGKFGDEAYDGSITPPTYNHLALCPAARGGSDLRITDSLVIIDERPAHLRDSKENVMKIKIGDAEVDATNGEAVSIAVQGLNKKLSDSETALGTVTAQLADAGKALEAKDGEIAALKKQLADAEITPAKLADMVKARAHVIDAAKAMGVTVTDADSDADIKKKVVTHKLGDAATGMSDAAIDGAFTAFISAVGGKKPDALRDALRDQTVAITDAVALEAQALAEASNFNSWRSAA